MTNFVSRIATGIAILGLAAPAFAATTTKSTTAAAPAARTSVVHSRTQKHKVASAEKAESKKSVKKVEKKGAVKSTKTETPAILSATPAPAK